MSDIFHHPPCVDICLQSIVPFQKLLNSKIKRKYTQKDVAKNNVFQKAFVSGQEQSKILYFRLHNLVTCRQQDKQNLTSMEKKLQDEKKAKTAVEQQLAQEKKAKKDEAAKAQATR